MEPQSTEFPQYSSPLPDNDKAITVTGRKQLLAWAPSAIDHWSCVALQTVIHHNLAVVLQIIDAQAWTNRGGCHAMFARTLQHASTCQLLACAHSS